MLFEQMRSAVAAAPRAKLPEMAALLWRAYGEGQVSEAEAETLSAAIDARKILPSPATAPKRRAGARPRTSASLERRRRWAASGALPPQLAARFTLAEVAVLAVVTAETAKHGRCSLTLGHIAALAGVCRTSVRNALREARAAGLIMIEERRQAMCRNAPNLVRVVSPEWRAWIARRGGRKSVSPTNTDDLRRQRSRLSEAPKVAGERGKKRRPHARSDEPPLADRAISVKLLHSGKVQTPNV